MQPGSSNVPYKCSQRVHLFWGQKVKGLGHSICVGFQSSDRTQCCRCYIRKPRWVFPAEMPRHTSSATDNIFSCISSQRPLADGCISVMLGMGFCTLVSAGFFQFNWHSSSSSYCITSVRASTTYREPVVITEACIYTTAAIHVIQPILPNYCLGPHFPISVD